jgi:hypothetical protein
MASKTKAQCRNNTWNDWCPLVIQVLSPHSAWFCFWDGGLAVLPRLASNLIFFLLSLPSSWTYRWVPPHSALISLFWRLLKQLLGLDGSRAVGHKSEALKALHLNSHEEGRNSRAVLDLTTSWLARPRYRSEVCLCFPHTGVFRCCIAPVAKKTNRDLLNKFLIVVCVYSLWFSK